MLNVCAYFSMEPFFFDRILKVIWLVTSRTTIQHERNQISLHCLTYGYSIEFKTAYTNGLTGVVTVVGIQVSFCAFESCLPKEEFEWGKCWSTTLCGHCEKFEKHRKAREFRPPWQSPMSVDLIVLYNNTVEWTPSTTSAKTRQRENKVNFLPNKAVIRNNKNI